MWYWLRRFEEALFYLPFLVYASLWHVTHYTRCRICGRLLFNYPGSMAGLCHKCARESFVNESGSFGEVGAGIAEGRAPVGAGLRHCYRRVAQKVGSGKILDVGCASGILLKILECQDRHLYGIDLSPGQIQRAIIYNKCAYYSVGDASRIPFESDSFDFAVSTDVLEHIESDEAVKELYRVLKPSGVALITVPNAKGISAHSTDHVRMFTYKSLKIFVEGAGFEIVSGSKFGVYIPFLTHVSEVLSLAAGKRLPLCSPVNIPVPESLGLATHLFIECRKPII